MSLEDDVKDIAAAREEMTNENRATASARKSQRASAEKAKAEMALLLDTIAAEVGSEVPAAQLQEIALRVIQRRIARREAESGFRGDGSLFLDDSQW